MSTITIILPVNHIDLSVFNVLSIHNRHFLPFRRRPNLPAVLYNRVGWEALRCKGFAVDNYRPDLTNQTASFAPRADPT